MLLRESGGIGRTDSWAYAGIVHFLSGDGDGLSGTFRPDHRIPTFYDGKKKVGGNAGSFGKAGMVCCLQVTVLGRELT